MNTTLSAYYAPPNLDLRLESVNSWGILNANFIIMKPLINTELPGKFKYNEPVIIAYIIGKTGSS